MCSTTSFSSLANVSCSSHSLILFFQPIFALALLWISNSEPSRNKDYLYLEACGQAYMLNM